MRLSLIAGVLALCVPALAAMATSPVPPSPAWLDELERMYPDAIRAAGLEQRTFSPEHWWQVATPLLSLAERGGRINDVGDLGDVRARRVIDASGLFVVPLADAATGAPAAMTTRSPARFVLSRDPAGRDVVWILDEDVDPARPEP